MCRFKAPETGFQHVPRGSNYDVTKINKQINKIHGMVLSAKTPVMAFLAEGEIEKDLFHVRPSIIQRERASAFRNVCLGIK